MNDEQSNKLAHHQGNFEMDTQFSASLTPLRGAIIGFGNVASHAHLPFWLNDKRFQIAAVTEPNPERTALVKKQLPKTPVFSDLKSMLASVQPDFVDICTPPSYHAEQIIQALECNVHVFCEKPLITSLESLKHILAFADANPADKVIFTVNNWKYAPLLAKAIQLVKENRIGAVTNAELNVLRMPGSGGGASDWRRRTDMAGGGILLDHGWHQLYLLAAFMQTAPTAVSARMQYTDEGGPDLEETVELTLRYPNREARLHLTWQASERRCHGMIKGEHGVIDIQDDHLTVTAGDQAPIRHCFDDALSGDSQHLEWMKPVTDHFYQEIHDPMVRGANFKEAQQCMLLIHYAYQSQQQNSQYMDIKLPPLY